MRYCSGYPASGVLRPLILAPCILFLYPPWASLTARQHCASGKLVFVTYRIDCNLKSRTGVGLNRCVETLLHRLWWFCTALVEIVGSGTAHSLPCLSLETTFRVTIKKNYATNPNQP